MVNDFLMLSQGDNVFVLSPTQATPIASYQQPVQTNQITFCHSGKKIFLTTGEGRTKILSYPSFEPILHLSYDPSTAFTLNGHTSSCLAVEIQPTGRFLATGGSDAIIALWDTTDVRASDCTLSLVSLGGYTAITLSNFELAKVQNANSPVSQWICQRTLIDMSGPVRSISFSFDGSYIVGGSDEGSELEIVHAETGEPAHTVKTAGPCPIVAWHPSRYWLAYTDLGSLRVIGVDNMERK